MAQGLVSRGPLLRRIERHSRFATLFRHSADDAPPSRHSAAPGWAVAAPWEEVVPGTLATDPNTLAADASSAFEVADTRFAIGTPTGAPYVSSLQAQPATPDIVQAAPAPMRRAAEPQAITGAVPTGAPAPQSVPQTPVPQTTPQQMPGPANARRPAAPSPVTQSPVNPSTVEPSRVAQASATQATAATPGAPSGPGQAPVVQRSPTQAAPAPPSPAQTPEAAPVAGNDEDRNWRRLQTIMRRHQEMAQGISPAQSGSAPPVQRSLALPEQSASRSATAEQGGPGFSPESTGAASTQTRALMQRQPPASTGVPRGSVQRVAQPGEVREPESLVPPSEGQDVTNAPSGAQPQATLPPATTSSAPRPLQNPPGPVSAAAGQSTQPHDVAPARSVQMQSESAESPGEPLPDRVISAPNAEPVTRAPSDTTASSQESVASTALPVQTEYVPQPPEGTEDVTVSESEGVPTPLQEVWPVQRRIERPGERTPAASARGTVQPAALESVSDPALESTLRSIPTGRPTTSAIEVLPPRLPRGVFVRAPEKIDSGERPLAPASSPPFSQAQAQPSAPFPPAAPAAPIPGLGGAPPTLSSAPLAPPSTAPAPDTAGVHWARQPAPSSMPSMRQQTEAVQRAELPESIFADTPLLFETVAPDEEPSAAMPVQPSARPTTEPPAALGTPHESPLSAAAPGIVSPGSVSPGVVNPGVVASGPAPSRPIRPASEAATSTVARSVAGDASESMAGATTGRMSPPEVDDTAQSAPGIPPENLVETEIGLLPGDLWELIGQPTPPVYSRLSPASQPAAAPFAPPPTQTRPLSPQAMAANAPGAIAGAVPGTVQRTAEAPPRPAPAAATSGESRVAPQVGFEPQPPPLGAPSQADAPQTGADATGQSLAQNVGLSSPRSANAVLGLAGDPNFETHRIQRAVSLAESPTMPERARIPNGARQATATDTAAIAAVSGGNGETIQRRVLLDEVIAPPAPASNNGAGGSGNPLGAGADSPAAPTGPTNETGSSAANDKDGGGEAAKIDIDELARQVYANIKRRLAVEWERLSRR